MCLIRFLYPLYACECSGYLPIVRLVDHDNCDDSRTIITAFKSDYCPEFELCAKHGGPPENIPRSVSTPVVADVVPQIPVPTLASSGIANDDSQDAVSPTSAPSPPTPAEHIAPLVLHSPSSPLTTDNIQASPPPSAVPLPNIPSAIPGTSCLRSASAPPLLNSTRFSVDQPTSCLWYHQLFLRGPKRKTGLSSSLPLPVIPIDFEF
ncbi:hypothetical protein NEOLEDRAFT_1238197 [Neolentinus lepideus HHB14362 ss-1]|uniref:Uncharacterized protein n=1 Tax=Neolentinus lepideus HHB14362 ss-1 TaxID=1314782 RepID=A0A165VQS5_9AGAM|nr:hypothetical protein NEOLEDRAFT_1238197 [Neolentinus lepideus HHB14362 ss-1]